MDASVAARIEKPLSRYMANRRCPVVPSISCSMVEILEIGRSGSISRMAALMLAISAVGSPVVLMAMLGLLSPVCATGKYSCTRRLPSSPSCRVCPTTPTTSSHLIVESLRLLKVIRLPTGSPLGQYRATISSSTMTTAGEDCRSCSLNGRPCLSGMWSVLRNPDEIDRRSPQGLGVLAGTWYPSTLKLPVDHEPPNGMVEVLPTASTPGTRLMAGNRRS